MKLYRTLAALTAWFGLLLQYYLIVQGQTGPAFAARTVNFFSYFTILSNLLAAIALSAPVVAPASPIGRFVGAPAVRTAIVLYTSVTAATYIVVLQGLWRPQGLQWVADTTLHYVTPALFLIDWLVFTPKGTLRAASPLPWLLFPLAYGVYSLARGPLSGFYPYPFLDVSQLGMSKVLVNLALMSLFFLATGLGFVLLDRLLRRRRA
ncbi:Pr6Pr family membrane protein [Phenylobacterium sp.]|uniref:Pr6Pr family membrane protein n=1 Tax=Phenylobacterium sp. TaxID=1871053 RepID=UPI00289A5333|nr:Pr6Pr family membrane protein [Phenylobacterium sp.]